MDIRSWASIPMGDDARYNNFRGIKIGDKLSNNQVSDLVECADLYLNVFQIIGCQIVGGLVSIDFLVYHRREEGKGREPKRKRKLGRVASSILGEPSLLSFIGFISCYEVSRKKCKKIPAMRHKSTASVRADMKPRLRGNDRFAPTFSALPQTC